MTRKATTLGLTLLPLAATVAAWLASGRERLSKTRRFVETLELDPLFGDLVARTHEQHGPIAGYFVGLDAVAGVSLATAGAIVIIWIVNRARRGRASTSGAGQ